MISKLSLLFLMLVSQVTYSQTTHEQDEESLRLFRECRQYTIDRCAERSNELILAGFASGPGVMLYKPVVQVSDQFYDQYMTIFNEENGCHIPTIWNNINMYGWDENTAVASKFVCGWTVQKPRDLILEDIVVTQSGKVVGEEDTAEMNKPINIAIRYRFEGVNPQMGAVYISSTFGTQNFELGHRNLSIFPSGQTQEAVYANFTFIPNEPGPKTLKVTLDIRGGGFTTESDYANNTLTKTVNLGFRDCQVSEKGRSVKFFGQAGGDWGADFLDHSTTKRMRSHGCAVTALAMLFDSYGIANIETGVVMDPGNLNDSLKKMNTPGLSSSIESVGFDSDANVHWKPAALLGRSSVTNQCLRDGGTQDICINQGRSAVSFKGLYSVSDKSYSYKLVERELCKGNPVILEVASAGTGSGSHFVLAVGTAWNKNEPTFLIHDPAISAQQERTLNDVYTRGVRGARVYSGGSGGAQLRALASASVTPEPSSLFIQVSENVDLLVTDAQGRRTGIDRVQNVRLEEIPGGHYLHEKGIVNSDPSATDKTDTPSRFIYYSDTAESGAYTIQLSPRTAGPYHIEILGFDNLGNVNQVQRIDGQIQTGQSVTIPMVHSDAPYVPSNATLKVGSFLLYERSKTQLDSMILTGSLKTTPNLNISGTVRVRVGNFSHSVPAGSFRKTKLGKATIWTYVYYNRSREAVVMIFTSDGTFNVDVKDMDILTKGQKTLPIEVEVGEVKAATSISLTCKVGLCKK